MISNLYFGDSTKVGEIHFKLDFNTSSVLMSLDQLPSRFV